MKLFSLILLTFLFVSCNNEINKTSNDDTVITEKIDITAQADSLKQLGYNVFVYSENDTEFLMQEYYMVQLLSGDNDSIPKVERDRLQKEHLKHLSRMYDEGYASLIGPMNNGNEWRGIVVYNTKNITTADSLARLDPFVKSGALKVKTTGWWTQKGGKLR
jgi:uncharacterized protein YciI